MVDYGPHFEWVWILNGPLAMTILFIYLVGANKMELFLTDGEEQHESSKLHENKFVLHIL